jgi:hypothetical protein
VILALDTLARSNFVVIVLDCSICTVTHKILRQRENSALLFVAPLNLPCPSILLVEQHECVYVFGRIEGKAPRFWSQGMLGCA